MLVLIVSGPWDPGFYGMYHWPVSSVASAVHVGDVDCSSAGRNLRFAALLLLASSREVALQLSRGRASVIRHSLGSKSLKNTLFEHLFWLRRTCSHYNVTVHPFSKKGVFSL